MKTTVHFTQYMRPDGHKVPVSTELGVEQEKVRSILRAGLFFEIEVLTNDMVSATITHPEHGDLAFAVVPNGPLVPAALEKMINNFDIGELT